MGRGQAMSHDKLAPQTERNATESAPSAAPESGGGGGGSFQVPAGYWQQYGYLFPGGPPKSIQMKQAAPSAPAAAPAGPAAGPAAPAAAGGGCIVPDETQGVQPGQLTRTQFLAALHQAVTAAASAALGPMWSAAGCPYIERWFARHAGTDAPSLERLAQRFSGLAQPAHAAADYIPPICARLSQGVARWQAGEDLSGELAAAGLSDSADAVGGAPAAGGARGAGRGAAVQRKESPASAGGRAGDPERVAS